MSDIILKSINREPFDYIELDMPKCALLYGEGLCKAKLGVTGDQKCYNTRATCQDVDNYDGSDTLTYSFCENRGYIPDDRYWFPYLETVKISAASLNIGGGNKNKSALGTMAALSASFSDHPHTDRIVDPYLSERDFDPYKRSTFWAKWRARNPYYIHREIRYYSGFINPQTRQIDQDTLIKRTFFVTGFGGFSAGGNVAMRAKDIMTFTNNDTAKAPRASTGKLGAPLPAGDTTLTLTPTGIGDLDYPASGKIRINKETISFTRSGDTMTLVRAVSNSTAAEHKLGDTVQLVLTFISKRPNEILERLYDEFTDTPPEFLDKAQWSTEVTDHLPRLYSAEITEPTGVQQLIGEMAEQMYFTTVWDERDAKLRIKSVRPSAGETITSLDDDRNLLADSVRWDDEADQLVTDVWVYYNQKNPNEKLDDVTNYSALDVISDPSSKGKDRNNTERIRQVFSRWINEGGAAIDLGDRILARYNEIPRSCSFSLDAKDGKLWLADFITATNYNVVDSVGLPETVAMQVISAQESQQGTTFSYVAQQYSGTEIGDSTGDIRLVISNDYVNLNLREYYDNSIGVAPVSGDKIVFTIRSGVTIGGCAFTSAENISNNAVTATDGVTTIFALNALSVLNGDYYFNAGGAPTSWLKRKTIQAKGVSSTATSVINVAAWKNTDPAPPIVKSRFQMQTYPKVASLRTGAWPAGVEVILAIEPGGTIEGQGGPSCLMADDSYLDAFVSRDDAYGGDGGDGIRVQHPISIDNGGIIGGGGGAGQMGVIAIPSVTIPMAGIIVGGSGAGTKFGALGNNGNAISLIDSAQNKPFNAVTITQASIGGLGGKMQAANFGSAISYAGGGLGQDGASFDGTDNPFGRGIFGLAGAAISEGANLITWINKGTVLGAENN